MQQLKRTWVEIDLDNLEHNYRLIRSRMKNETRLMAIVKADGYGHGSVQAAGVLEEAGADWFGVSNIVEAKMLRKSGISSPILILGYTPEEYADELFQLGITQTVLGEEYAERLAASALRAGVVVDVHLKLDTGMSRLGFQTGNLEDLLTSVGRVCYLPALNVTGVFTHFASADDTSENGRAFTAKQYNRFASVINELLKRGFTFRDIHCCNSAATVFYPQCHNTMVRPGILLYGLSPTGAPIDGLDLRPVMTLRSVVSLVKTVKAGERISYGGTYEAYENMRVATVPIGYADGYSRSLSSRGYAYISDKVVPIVGRVCMDQLMIDVTGIEASEGDIVTFFGGGTPISTDNVARLVGTVNYELVCGISKRVQRVYIKGGKVVEVVDYTA